MLTTRGSAEVEGALTDIDILSVLLFDGQVYECIFQTATMVLEQVAQKLFDLHMETGNKIAVFGHRLGCGVAVLLMIKLFSEGFGNLKGPEAYQTCRRWGFANLPCFGPLVKMLRWVYSTTYSFIHDVDVVPRSSLNNIVKTVMAFKQVDEMRLTCISSADQRLEQHLPDRVDVPPLPWTGRALPGPSQHRDPAPAELGRRRAHNVLPGSARTVGPRAPPSCMGSCHVISRCYQRIYDVTQALPPAETCRRRWTTARRSTDGHAARGGQQKACAEKICTPSWTTVVSEKMWISRALASQGHNGLPWSSWSQCASGGGWCLVRGADRSTCQSRGRVQQ